MIVSRGADLAAILGRDGVPVTLGAATANAMVHAADETDSAGGASPVRLTQRAVVVLVRAGDLPGLAQGAAITVVSGPLAGVYNVDRWLSVADGEQLEILAR